MRLAMFCLRTADMEGGSRGRKSARLKNNGWQSGMQLASCHVARCLPRWRRVEGESRRLTTGEGRSARSRSTWPLATVLEGLDSLQPVSSFLGLFSLKQQLGCGDTTQLNCVQALDGVVFLLLTGSHFKSPWDSLASRHLDRTVVVVLFYPCVKDWVKICRTGAVAIYLPTRKCAMFTIRDGCFSPTGTRFEKTKHRIRNATWHTMDLCSTGSLQGFQYRNVKTRWSISQFELKAHDLLTAYGLFVLGELASQRRQTSRGQGIVLTPWSVSGNDSDVIHRSFALKSSGAGDDVQGWG